MNGVSGLALSVASRTVSDMSPPVVKDEELPLQALVSQRAMLVARFAKQDEQKVSPWYRASEAVEHERAKVGPLLAASA